MGLSLGANFELGAERGLSQSGMEVKPPNLVRATKERPRTLLFMAENRGQGEFELVALPSLQQTMSVLCGIMPKSCT